jgi:hypothetical protein
MRSGVMRPTRIADGYIRVSRAAGREGESFISPDVQRQKIQAWADAGFSTVSSTESCSREQAAVVEPPPSSPPERRSS